MNSLHQRQPIMYVDEVHRGIKDLCTFLKSYRPSFDDYLESVLAISLKETERKALIEGGCGKMISTTGELVMNPRMYAHFVTFSLQFFDLVCGGSAPLSEKSGPMPVNTPVNTDNKR